MKKQNCNAKKEVLSVEGNGTKNSEPVITRKGYAAHLKNCGELTENARLCTLLTNCLAGDVKSENMLAYEILKLGKSCYYSSGMKNSIVKEDAEDIIQECSMRLLKRVTLLLSEENPKAYILKSFKNAFIDKTRKQKKNRDNRNEECISNLLEENETNTSGRFEPAAGNRTDDNIIYQQLRTTSIKWGLSSVLCFVLRFLRVCQTLK